jgi:hypothetical protein
VGELAPGAFLVIAGDSVAARTAHLELDLQNGPDAVRLRRGTEILDRLGYGALVDPQMFEGRPAVDVSGAALARLPDGRDTDNNAADFGPAPPSPGRRNLPLRALQVELLAFDPTHLWPGRQARFAARVRNVGQEPLSDTSWEMAARVRPVAGEPYLGEASPGAPLPVELRGAAEFLAPADTARFEVSFGAQLGLFDLEVAARATIPDSALEIARAYVRVGPGDVLVNEIQFAPERGEPEWIELWNRGSRPHDLAGWTLTDASGKPAHLRAARALAAGSYAVVSADTVNAVRDLDAAALRAAATPWPSLNNSDGDAGFADWVVLRDPAGVPQDAVFYSGSWRHGAGHSLERVTPDPDVRGLLWATSQSISGATPGRVNTEHAPPAPRAGVRLEPNPFSPDGDGRDDQLHVVLEIPEGFEGFRAQVFDLSGERRAHLGADRLGPGPRRLLWDGKDSGSNPLPTGIYVLHLEVFSKSGKTFREVRTLGLVRR